MDDFCFDARIWEAERNGDMDAVRRLVVEELTRENPHPAALKWVATMLDPKAATPFKLEIEKRGSGSLSQMRETSERFDRLFDLWTSLDDHSQFVARAMAQEGISKTAANNWRLKLLEAEEASRD